MVKDIVVVADLGAAGNLVKNLLLLSDQTDWPLRSDRLARILNQYTIDLELKDWLKKEYKLRFWSQYYGLDLSDNLDSDQFNKLPLTDKTRVWLNHSAFWQAEQFNWFAKHCNIVYVAPTTVKGLEWQIRSYANKKTVQLLHDFCFEHNREQQQRTYIQEHGAEAYHLLNITNMKCIIDQRQQEFRKQVSPAKCIDLELLLTGSVDAIHHGLKQVTGLDIEVDYIDKVIMAWRKLHWDITTKWEYSGIFQQ